VYNRGVIRIYRRHVEQCGYTSERERRCRCPIHVEGRLGEEVIKRRSLHLNVWDAALKKVRDWEIAGTTKAPARVTLRQAIADYQADCAAREIQPATILKTKVLLDKLQAFATENRYEFLDEIGIAELRKFRSTWTTWGPLTQRKNIDRTRSFFNWAADNKWIEPLRRKALKYPEIEPSKVTVFAEEELQKIHATIKRPIMSAFILVLQHTGLRISDAVQLKKQDITNGKLRISTEKTGSNVWLPLPPPLLAALENIKTTEYYFWTGASKLSTVIGSKRRGVAKLLNRAGVCGNPHKFRHTLATTLLSNGTSAAVVAKILGNSPRVVEKYYDHWIAARQAQLEAELQKTWHAPLLRIK
jgi:integrase